MLAVQHEDYIYTERERGWNNKSVVLKKTTQQLYFKTFIEKSIQVTWLCSRADIYSMLPPSASITASIWILNSEHAFSTSAGRSSANTRLMAAIRLALMLWGSCRCWCWWCSQRMTKWSSPADSGQGRRRVSERRVQSRSNPSEAKPSVSGLVGRHRVLLPHPGSATGHLIASLHFSAHPGTLWCWLSSRLRRCEVVWCGRHLKSHQRP